MIDTKILIIDDEEEICWVLKRILASENIETEFTHSGAQAIRLLQQQHFDLILLDFKLPDTDGFKLLKQIKDMKLTEDTEVILMTAYGDFKTGTKAINMGCYDYVAKPFNFENLIFRIKKALENISLQRKVKMLSQSFNTGFEEIIGNSKKMQEIYKTIKKVADKDATVLIEGETGTGKELIAKAIYNNSKRKENIYIPVNCGALSETILESELFGHEKGAFTGATTLKYGIFETANNGTVFLDEINNASLNVQSKLLRFIETGEFIRVGGNKVIYSDIRIISATNEKIEKLLNEKKLRLDLYHRLNVVRITVPPLRERGDDIILLIDYFLNMYNKKFGKNIKISEKATKQLMEYNWPGNVRQLKNIIQSLVLLNETGTILPDDLPDNILKKRAIINTNISFKKLKKNIVSEFEINYLKDILKKVKEMYLKQLSLLSLTEKILLIN